MDQKNVVAAISLSAAVIILYSLFFAPEPQPRNQNLAEKNKTEQNSDAPSLDQEEKVVEVSRAEAIEQNERIKFENQNIIGSISLKGATIDDLTFKNYDTTLDSNVNVTLLNPRNIKDGYFIESGFVTTDKNIDIPNSDSIWEVKGNRKLTEQNPVRLTWTNDKELLLKKKYL